MEYRKTKTQDSRFKIQDSGFTLIELLVVISIIGILIGLSVFGLQGARKSSRDAVRKADLEQIRSGLGMYKADCNSYPLTANFSLPGASTLAGNGSSTSCPVTNVYISKVPADSVPAYSYHYVSNGVTYSLCAYLEQPPSPAMPGIGNCGSGTCGSGITCNYITTNP